MSSRINRVIIFTIILIVCLVSVKNAMVRRNIKGIGSFETEKEDILCRRNYLSRKILVEPETLISEMPSILGDQFCGEWALYSCSMFAAALVDISRLYPETREESVATIDSLISIAMSPELRKYDADRWGEDPLESLSGDNSHISYLSHLAWIIGNYKAVGGGKEYDRLYHSLCSTMNRRILDSPAMNLETYPGEYSYVPDMLVAIVALSQYSRRYGGKYDKTVSKWLTDMKERYVDLKTGIIPSYVPDHYAHNFMPVKGSYSALSCYYLTYVDETLSRDQYDRICSLFLKKWPLHGLKEYYSKGCILGLDVDAGPIIMNLSPTGTAFFIGPLTYFGDDVLRKKFLKTAEIAGTTVLRKDERHYRLANIALVGEAITLAMRVHIKE